MLESCQYFGTDGIRGRMGILPITPEFILKLGWATGCMLANGNSKVLIGKDTRISGYMLESALEAGLSAAGVDIQLLGPIPTPALAYLTRTLRAKAGIMISASHNPYYDNGIKFFSSAGIKLDSTVEHAIEAQLLQPMTVVDPIRLGKATRIEDAKGRYIEFCKSTMPPQFDLKGLKIVLDCAHGATYQVAPIIFSELGATVFPFGIQPDGLNINEQCGSVYPQFLQKQVLSKKADLGIAFDGDGDRVVMVDHTGAVCDGDTLLFILAKAGLQSGSVQNGVVGTAMSNRGLELAIRELGLDFIRAKVGDRYVHAALQETGWQLGGETSGHLICRNLTTTGDGIIAALQVLAAMDSHGTSLHMLKAGWHPFPQRLINVRAAMPPAVIQSAKVQHAITAAQQMLGQEGRILLRPSGTEAFIRVMVEGPQKYQVNRVAENLAQIITQTAQ